MPLILITVGAIGLAVVFPPILFLYVILAGVMWAELR